MEKIRNFINSEKVLVIVRAVSIFVMLLLIYVYLLNADLSTAPEFIYNQF